MAAKRNKSKYTIGIDEVGRGPIAGPVAVCALCLGPDFNNKNFKNFRDSKKLSHLQRCEWLEKINLEKKKGNIFYKVCFESNKVIDKKGIVFAITRALNNSLRNLKINLEDSLVLLDGGLTAPVEYKYQKTIIKGDEKELAIALASIAAKVTRDEYMVKIAKKYTGYSLEKHKGYGTQAHYKALKNKGISAIHRKSFLKKIIGS
jgi:ribonuclease HII